MSKLVQEYFRNYTSIRFSGDLEDDSYNNMLTIEKCVENCYKKKLITEFELRVIQGVCKGYNYSELSNILNADRLRISTTFKSVCSRIAYILGSEFTDEYLIENYYGK